MSRKHDAAYYLEQAKVAEKKAEEARKKAAEAAKAEKAKVNAKIIKAIEKWQATLSVEDRTPWEDIPKLFEGMSGKIGAETPAPAHDWFNEYQQAKKEIEKLKNDVTTRIKPKYDEMEADLGKWQEAADRYGISQQELLDYILTDRQISFFQRNHNRSVVKVRPAEGGEE